jgi:hypothetical protein
LSLCTCAIYSYPVLNLPHELYRKVSAVLRHTVLVVRLERTDHVRIVPIGPHSRLGYVVRKELLELEPPRRSRPPLGSSAAEALFLKRGRKVFRLFGVAVSLLPARVSSQVCLGCPRKPWTKRMLHRVSQSAGCVAARSQRCRYQTVA